MKLVLLFPTSQMFYVTDAFLKNVLHLFKRQLHLLWGPNVERY